MTPSIALTSPRGKIGSAFIAEAASAGIAVRALARAGAEVPAGAETTAFDFADASTYEPALRGVETLFLLSPVAPDLGERERAVIGAARRSTVRHVVLLSTTVVHTSTIIAAELHRAGDSALVESGLDWTILEPTFFMQNALAVRAAVEQGVFPQAYGDARVGQIDARDIGAVAFQVARDPRAHAGARYTLTSPSAYTGAEMAAAIEAAAGQPVRYVPVSDDAFRAALRERGANDWTIENVAQLYAHARSGAEDVVSRDARAVLGREPRTFEAFAGEHFAGAR